MTITLSPELEAALRDLASRRGVSPEELALAALRERFLTPQPIVPQDEWERRLLAIASDCGVSLPDSALSREKMYD